MKTIDDLLQEVPSVCEWSLFKTNGNKPFGCTIEEPFRHSVIKTVGWAETPNEALQIALDKMNGKQP